MHIRPAPLGHGPQAIRRRRPPARRADGKGFRAKSVFPARGATRHGTAGTLATSLEYRAAFGSGLTAVVKNGHVLANRCSGCWASSSPGPAAGENC